VAAVLLAALCASGEPAVAAAALTPGTIGLRLLDEPAGAGGDPRARLYIVDHIPPGGTITRRMEVTNTTASTAHVALYAGGAAIVGGAFVGAVGHSGNEPSTWTHVSPSASDIPAGGHSTVAVRISVPTDASPGERYGVVWAEVQSSPAAGGGLRQINRVGIRLYLSIGPGAAPAANFSIDTVSASRGIEGAPRLLAAVHNIGGRALDLFGTLRLSAGPGGLNVGPVPAVLGTTVAVSGTETVAFILATAIPNGPWTAQITLHSGRLTRTARARITFPARGAPPTVDRVKAAPRRSLFHPLLASLLLLLLLIAGATWVLRRSSRRSSTDETARR
jgi:hypothetical protein